MFCLYCITQLCHAYVTFDSANYSCKNFPLKTYWLATVHPFTDGQHIPYKQTTDAQSEARA